MARFLTPRHGQAPVISKGARVLLIVEDDPSFAQTIATLASGLQFECVIATTADEGIELALEHRPTAIVLDIRLPDHTGLTVLDRLKHDPATRHIPVQVISGHDYTHVALEMGAANVLRKPVEREELLNSLTKLASKANDATRAVLIVEDNAIQRDSIEHLLRSEQVQTVAVASAADALEKLRSSTFDCMVLDLALPDASGYELLEKMATDEAYSFPPVIVYTGRTLSTDEEQQHLVNEAVAVHEPLAQQKGIRLVAECDALAVVVLCDRERILQVFANLLGNAIKFCRHGDQIRVSMQRVDERMQASVIDTGPGIASEDLPLVFDAYFSGAKNRRNGTGLGLYITKRIVEAHEGNIWIDSEPGKGTAVHFTLPLATLEVDATN